MMELEVKMKENEERFLFCVIRNISNFFTIEKRKFVRKGQNVRNVRRLNNSIGVVYK